jgi:hypothetical protein
MDGSAVVGRGYRFGGAAALVLAALSAAAAVFYVLLPAEQRLGVPGRLLLPSFAADPVPLQLEMLSLTAMGIVGLAVVGPIRSLVGADDAWLRWTSLLALIGYAVGAIGNSLVMGKLPPIAAAYIAADEASKPIIAVFWRTTLDPFGLWQFGAVGVWLLVVGIVARGAGGGIPPSGAYLAIAAGVAHLAIPVVLLAAAQPMLDVLALVAAVAIVAWFGWVGMHLWRRGDTATAA